MNENMKKFTEQLTADPALAEKLRQIQAQYVKSLAALAKEAGYDLSEEDFMPKNEKLTDDELEKAAGGGYYDYDWKAMEEELRAREDMSRRAAVRSDIPLDTCDRCGCKCVCSHVPGDERSVPMTLCLECIRQLEKERRSFRY